MKNNIIITSILLIIIQITNGNIWDSLFSEVRTPFLDMPDDFIMQLSYNSIFFNQLIYLNFSGTFNKISITDQIIFLNESSNLGRLIIDFNEGILYLNTPFENCTWNDIESIKNNHINISKIKNLWDLTSTYMETTNDNHTVFNVSTIFKYFNYEGDVYFIFDQNNTLKYIESEWKGQEIRFNVDKLEKHIFNSSDFIPPDSWQCNQINSTNLDELGSNDIATRLISKLLKIKP